MNGKLNGKQKIYDDLFGKLKIEEEYINGILSKGKVYNYKGLLLFDGEYLYGHKRKGKTYVKGKLEYEGEYLFDRKYNGKGYDEDGNIIYELINGNGTVKEYEEGENIIYTFFQGNITVKNDVEGEVIFEGEYLKGKRWNGIFKGYKYGQIQLKGEYINGVKIIQ